MKSIDPTEIDQLKKIRLEVDRLFKNEFYTPATVLTLYLAERLLSAHGKSSSNIKNKPHSENSDPADPFVLLLNDEAVLNGLRECLQSSSGSSDFDKKQILSLSHVLMRFDECLAALTTSVNVSARQQGAETRLFHRVKHIQSSFQSIVVLFDNGDLRSTAIVLNDLFSQLEKVMDFVQTNIPQSETHFKLLLEKFLPHWAEDRSFIQSLLCDETLDEKIETDTKNLAKSFYAVISRMREAIRLISREVNQVVFQRPGAKVWLKINLMKNRILIFTALTGMAVLFFCYLFMIRDHGLRGDYFRGEAFDELVITRRDRTVSFNWKTDAPSSLLPEDRFSVRWTGRILIPEDGPYTFSVSSDDGVRLWIDDEMVIDDWNVHPFSTQSKNVHLSKGAHDIKLEYFERARNASVALRWIRGTTGQPEVIASRYLRRS